jgi:hypothetical protein
MEVLQIVRPGVIVRVEELLGRDVVKGEVGEEEAGEGVLGEEEGETSPCKEKTENEIRRRHV